MAPDISEFTSGPSRRLRAFALCGTGAIILTCTVWISPLSRYVGGPSDPMKFMEFIGWYPFAIMHAHNPLMNNYVNLPSGSNMMWDTTVPLLSVLLWPFTAVGGPILTWNIAITLGLALDGWCSYLWLRRHTARDLAALVGALVIEFGPYATTRAHSHLNLLLFFPIPLLLVLLERVLQGRANRIDGVAAGVLAGVQLLLCEELLAIAVVAVGLTLAIGSLGHWRVARMAAGRLISVAPTAVAAFIVLAGVPVLYQFFGPGRITDPIQPPGVYATDIANFIIPGAYTALNPAFAQHMSASWFGGVMENDAYIGVPLLVLTLIVARRCWHEVWPRLVIVGILTSVVLSLGSHLHVDGHVIQFLPLPGELLAHLPVFDNILPARFDVLIDLALGGFVALYMERVDWRESRIASLRAGCLLLLVAVTLAPQTPLPTYFPAVPRYFEPGGDVEELAQGTVALVVPYGDGENTMAPMLWQAVAGFRFKMVAGAMYTAGKNGSPSLGRSLWGTGTTMDCIMQLEQSGEAPTPCTSDPVAVMRSSLKALGVKVFIVGPLGYGSQMAFSPRITALLSKVAGGQPIQREGILLWAHPWA